MHRIMLTAMLLAPTALLPAQVDADGTKSKSAKAAYQMLTEEYSQAQTEFQRLASIAREAGERVQLGQAAVAFVPRFQQAAKDYAGTEDAVQFLTWITLNAGSDADATNAAIDEILAHHVGSAQLSGFAVGAIIGELGVSRKRVAEIKSQLLAKGHPGVKGAMLYFSGNSAINARDASAEAINAGLEDLRQAAKYGGPWGTRAESMLFKRERLQIGMVAPDIVGPDIDGVEFSLSDYRGKVVVIDFWGDW